MENYDLLLGAARASMVFAGPPYNVRIESNVIRLGKVKHRESAVSKMNQSR